MRIKNNAATYLSMAALPLFLFGCGGEPTMSYSKDVQPIVQANCAECHTGKGMGIEKSGLDMSTYEGLMKGTKFGPVIVPGNSVSSTLVLLIQGKADPSISMPHGTKGSLSEADIQTMVTWIDQGAKDN